jgi:predicted kinase
VARLLVINGAPGSGKSTLARLLANRTPLSLVLDVDSIRGSLGRWAEDPAASGIAARRLATAMASAHLLAGHDVLVPQFLRRPDFLVELEGLARAAGAEFVEVALVSSPGEAAARFAARSSSPDPNHDAARALQAGPGAMPVEELYSAMLAMLAGRPGVRYVESIPGEVDRTLRNLLRALNR